MNLNASFLGVVAAGSRVIAVGHFTGGQSNEILFQSPMGSYFLWTNLESGAPRTVPVTLPSGYHVLDAGSYNAATPGCSELLLENALGNLAYGTYVSAAAIFTATSIGNPGPGWSVVASADYSIWYDGSAQVLLQAIQNDTVTLNAYQSDLPAFTVPAGFAVIPYATGNFFGADLPETLLCNESGTVEALMSGGTVVAQGVTTVVSKVSVLGTLQAGQTITAVSGLNSNGATDILLQNAGTLSEWIVQEGVVQQTLTLGALPSGSTVSGFADFDGDGTPDILLTLNTGQVQVITGSPTATPSVTANASSAAVSGTTVTTAPLNKSKPGVIVDGNYSVVTGLGANSTLSDYLAELTSGALGATGARVLTMQQGALSSCSFEQVAAGNITLAAWEQNVATLNAIAQACRSQGVVVQIETVLGENRKWGPLHTEQWLMPAVTAGLPIAYVEDNQELMNWSSLNVQTMAASMLQNIALIHAALPNAVFGEWDTMGALDDSAYAAFLDNWWGTLNGSAAALGLPGISYVIADQYYSPELGPRGVASAAGKNPGQDITYNQLANFAKNAEANGIAVEIQAAASDVDLSPLQILARQELEVSQEATLGISGIQLSASFNPQPVSAAVNVPGSTYNGAAEIAAIEPLYQAGLITTTGSISLNFPSQIVLPQNTTIGVSGLSVIAEAADQSKRLAVVLIDQTGTLSATQRGGGTVNRDGANILILDGTPADVAAELATVTLNEVVSGPDSIDVEVFGSTGRIAGGTIWILATNADGGTNFLPSSAGALSQIWQSASAQVINGTIASETLTWNSSDGLGSSAFIGGTTIAPIMQIAVEQPLLEQGLTSDGTIASLQPSILQWSSGWKTYNPLHPNGSTSETVPVTVTASTISFDPISGSRNCEIDTIGAIPQSSFSGVFPFAASVEPYYFANGGSAVTVYNTGNNANWSSALYDNGGGGISEISSGPTMVIANGSTTSMIVGSIQTIYGNINGVQRVIEVCYFGGPTNPYDKVEQIYNPYSATPQLWQQIQTVAIPSSMAGSAPLVVPSATTVIEFNTGNNPNFPVLFSSGDLEVATTFENGNWDSRAEISAEGVASVQRGVTWIGEGKILNAYTLAAPVITGWTLLPLGSRESNTLTGGSISGTGIAGDWVVVTGSSGQTLGGGKIGANGTWTITPSAGFTLQSNTTCTAQQFDLAGDSSWVSAAFNINTKFVSDTAIDVAANLDELEARAISGNLISITLTDIGKPILNVRDDQIAADAAALACIKTPYILDPSAASAAAAAALPNVIAVGVEDTAANIVANLNVLETLAAGGKLASITLTDSSTPTLTLTAAQMTADAAALALIKSSWNLSLVTPTIRGTMAGQAITTQGIAPFSGVAIGDANGQTETVTVTLSVAANGTLTNLGGGTYSTTNGVYVATGTAAAVTAALDGLVFLPTCGKVAGGRTVTTGFTINVTDTALVSATDATTSVVVTPGKIVLSGPSSQYIIADDNGSLHVQDTVAGRNGTQVLAGVNEMVFTNGIGVFDPTGTAEDIARLYGAVLDRAPDVAGLEFWTTAIDDSNVPLSQVATSFTTSPEFIADYGSLSDAAFVNQLYANVLGRVPDPAGAQSWNNALASGVSRGTVLLGFAESQENKANTLSTAGDKDTAEAYRLYQAALNRVPDPVGLADWSSALANGATLTQVAQGFIGSAEFQADHGTLSIDDFVISLYQNVLNRAPDAAGFQSWTSALQHGASEASVLIGFSDSIENRTLTAGATHANWVLIPQ